MRTWVMKPEMRSDSWPDDLMCFEFGDGTLLYIQHDGGIDFSHVDNGSPSLDFFDAYESTG
jgi:hypothetical protein